MSIAAFQRDEGAGESPSKRHELFAEIESELGFVAADERFEEEMT
jgi:hypothetical protein